VARLGGDDKDGQPFVAFDLFQAFHDLETVHARHLEVEQDRGIAILAVQAANRSRIHRRLDGRIAGVTQDSF
jgi:hypothetical protein